MTGIAVLKVDDLGRRPLLMIGVSGLVCILTIQQFSSSLLLIFVLCDILADKDDDARFNSSFFYLPQTLSLFLLSAYYKFLGGFPLVAVASLLLYVGCYQVKLFYFGSWHLLVNLLNVLFKRNSLIAPQYCFCHMEKSNL